MVGWLEMPSYVIKGRGKDKGAEDGGWVLPIVCCAHDLMDSNSG